ncbi:hypothetical protein GCM10023116_04970 [Kistimonas scapharcae]|uniref:Ethanolamine utilization protein EutN n=2 Tax=Kistimonas scapharcae TaxID=1036133 RepID=A0ABP8UZE1_9GAMM
MSLVDEKELVMNHQFSRTHKVWTQIDQELVGIDVGRCPAIGDAVAVFSSDRNSTPLVTGTMTREMSDSDVYGCLDIVVKPLLDTLHDTSNDSQNE